MRSSSKCINEASVTLLPRKAYVLAAQSSYPRMTLRRNGFTSESSNCSWSTRKLSTKRPKPCQRRSATKASFSSPSEGELYPPQHKRNNNIGPAKRSRDGIKAARVRRNASTMLGGPKHVKERRGAVLLKSQMAEIIPACHELRPCHCTGTSR